MTNGDDFAWPGRIRLTTGPGWSVYGGLTKREEFAKSALEGILSSGRKEVVLDKVAYDPETAAVMIADRLIKALNKEVK